MPSSHTAHTSLQEQTLINSQILSFPAHVPATHLRLSFLHKIKSRGCLFSPRYHPNIIKLREPPAWVCCVCVYFSCAAVNRDSGEPPSMLSLRQSGRTVTLFPKKISQPIQNHIHQKKRNRVDCQLSTRRSLLRLSTRV